MKKIIFLLASTLCYSQSQVRINKTESFNMQVVVDPHASFKENGLNFGAGIEYNRAIYTRASFTVFNALKGGYFDLTGSIGLNLTSGYFENIRYYAGGRLGFIKRESNTYPTAGVEAGININLSDNIFIGARSTYDKRSDFEFYGAPSEMRGSTFLLIGFKL